MIDREAESQSERDYKMIESLRARVEEVERIAETAERERYEAQSDFAASANENEGLKNGSRDLMLINSKMSAALDAADRFAKMVRQHAAQNAGYDASSDITTGDIGQEYEFYQAARAAVGKAGGALTVEEKQHGEV